MFPFLFISALTSQSPSGTGITMYGSHLTPGNASAFLDGYFMRTVLNDTTSGDQVSLIYYSNNMEDGDHQLEWESPFVNASVQIAYFELVPLPHFISKTLC